MDQICGSCVLFSQSVRFRIPHVASTSSFSSSSVLGHRALMRDSKLVTCTRASKKPQEGPKSLQVGLSAEHRIKRNLSAFQTDLSSASGFTFGRLCQESFEGAIADCSTQIAVQLPRGNETFDLGTAVSPDYILNGMQTYQLDLEHWNRCFVLVQAWQWNSLAEAPPPLSRRIGWCNSAWLRPACC